jgi:hypothetical protein
VALFGEREGFIVGGDRPVVIVEAHCRELGCAGGSTEEFGLSGREDWNRWEGRLKEQRRSR